MRSLSPLKWRNFASSFKKIGRVGGWHGGKRENHQGWAAAEKRPKLRPYGGVVKRQVPSIPQLLYSQRQVASRLGVSTETIKRRERDGLLRGIRFNQRLIHYRLRKSACRGSDCGAHREPQSILPLQAFPTSPLHHRLAYGTSTRTMDWLPSVKVRSAMTEPVEL